MEEQKQQSSGALIGSIIIVIILVIGGIYFAKQAGETIAPAGSEISQVLNEDAEVLGIQEGQPSDNLSDINEDLEGINLDELSVDLETLDL